MTATISAINGTPFTQTPLAAALGAKPPRPQSDVEALNGRAAPEKWFDEDTKRKLAEYASTAWKYSGVSILAAIVKMLLNLLRAIFRGIQQLAGAPGASTEKAAADGLAGAAGALDSKAAKGSEAGGDATGEHAAPNGAAEEDGHEAHALTSPLMDDEENRAPNRTQGGFNLSERRGFGLRGFVNTLAEQNPDPEKLLKEGGHEEGLRALVTSQAEAMRALAAELAKQRPVLDAAVGELASLMNVGPDEALKSALDNRERHLPKDQQVVGLHEAVSNLQDRFDAHCGDTMMALAAAQAAGVDLEALGVPAMLDEVVSDWRVRLAELAPAYARAKSEADAADAAGARPNLRVVSNDQAAAGQGPLAPAVRASFAITSDPDEPEAETQAPLTLTRVRMSAEPAATAERQELEESIRPGA